MEALWKVQQMRLQKVKGTPFFKKPSGKAGQRPAGRKFWVSLIMGGLGVLLFISFGESVLLLRAPSPTEQKTAAGEDKKPTLPPGNLGEKDKPSPEIFSPPGIDPPSQSSGNQSKFRDSKLRNRKFITPVLDLPDPGIEKPFPLANPPMERKKDLPKERTAEETKGPERKGLQKTDGPMDVRVHPAASLKEAASTSGSVNIKQADEKEHSVAKKILTHFNRGVYFTQERDLGKAVQAYNKVLELEPNYVEAYNNLAIVYQEMGDLEKARLAYQKSIELNPRYEKAYNNLGILLYIQGRYEESIGAFQKALAINPHNMESYVNLGILFKKLGQMDQAIECYQKGLRINPLNPEAHYNIALLYDEQLGNGVLAIRHYQEFVRRSTKNHSDLVSRVKRRLDELSGARRENDREKG